MNKFVLAALLCSFLIFSGNTSADVIHSERSLYRNIIVEEQDDLRCLRFNVKSSKTNQSCMLKSNPNKLVFNYTKLMFSSLLLVDDPKSVLVIGLGGGTMSNIIHQIYPDAKIDNVEIDPAVIKVARKYFGFFENDNVRSIVKDGRIFIKRAQLKKQKYDWIILDAFNGDYIPEHLMTKEFFEETRSILSEDGVLSANTFSVSELYAYESATYQHVFGSFLDVSNNKNTNRIILASRKRLPTTAEMLVKAKRLTATLSPFGVDILRIINSIRSTRDKQDWPKDTPILTDQFSPANLLNQ